MANKTIIGKVQVRIDTAENWSQHNPVLLLNEIVGEKQTDGSLRFKCGDGVTTYNLLGYITFAEPTHDGDPATKEFVENEITSASIEILGSVIRKDGTTETTAQIPFKQGIKADTISENTSGKGVAIANNTNVNGALHTTGGLRSDSGLSFTSSDISNAFVSAANSGLSLRAAGAIKITTTDTEGTELWLTSPSIKARDPRQAGSTPFMAIEDDDVVTKKFYDDQLLTGISNYAIRSDGTSNLSAKIPFASGLKTSSIENTTSGQNIVVRDGLDMASGSITGLAEPTQNSDAATKGYVDTQITSNTPDLSGYMKLDGTSTATATIPFTQGIRIPTVTGEVDPFQFLNNAVMLRVSSAGQTGTIIYNIGESTSNMTGIMMMDADGGYVQFMASDVRTNNNVTPATDWSLTNKHYVDNAISEAMAGSTAGGVKLLEVTLPSGSWTAYGDSGVAWQQTVSNAAITAGTYISIDADVDEIVAHLTDTPITNLTVGTPTAGSAVVYAISEAQPTSDYNVRLVVHEVSE